MIEWEVNNRTLLCYLPPDKYKNWCNRIYDMLEQGCTHMDYLESLIGQLNHAEFVIPLSRHFLGRLRRLLYHSKYKNNKSLLPSNVVQDLQLWVTFLNKASNDSRTST